MNLQLSRPLAFFDLETTGIQVGKDKIVEICILKVQNDGTEECKTWKVNPGMPIPKQSSDIHGITDEMVKDCPTFPELAVEIYSFIKDSDLSGYNSNRFDLPLIAEEFLRADIDFDMKNRRSIDVQSVFFKMEPRTLTAAYKFYCNKDLLGAHGAEADTRATYEILKAQVERYEELDNDSQSMADFTQPHQPNADLAGMIKFDTDGEEIFNFGKHKGKKVLVVMAKEPGYYGWIQNADFPRYTKKVLTAIKLRSFNK
ncbi:MAG: DNA polymerase-3 subunit epsilon [Flavobacteriales bacterium]|jgi:DNA polymerase-3 subunit epsilon